MKTTDICLAYAADLNKTDLADGRFSQLCRELTGEAIRWSGGERRYAMPSGRLTKSADKCIAAWREAAKA